MNIMHSAQLESRLLLGFRLSRVSGVQLNYCKFTQIWVGVCSSSV